MVSVVLGLQWGDEGKGKIVDILSKDHDCVCRFQGGNNAGHTVIINGEKFVLNLIPAGVLNIEKHCLLGNGVVIDLGHLIRELDYLHDRRVDVDGRLIVSESSHAILPYHKMLDKAREIYRSKNSIGTTLKGIGPAYEDKTARESIRFCDFKNSDKLEKKLAEKHSFYEDVIGYYTSDIKFPEFNKVFETLMTDYKKVESHFGDTFAFIHDKMCMEKEYSFLLEGAQGFFLDLDQGTYPFVTSSNTSSGAACVGTGFSPMHINKVLGVFKAYTTRVGSGPFPTELFDKTGEHIQNVGKEFGATTGRSRRCGWLDLPLLRKALFVNGVTETAVTKIDVLDQFEEIKVCVAYEDESGKRYRLPPEDTELFYTLKPIYQTLEGWNQNTQSTINFESLPDKCHDYIKFLQDELDTKISFVSTGPDRFDTIFL